MNVVLDPIGMDDVALVDVLLDGLAAYSMKVDGVPRRADGARHLLTATPPGYGREHKIVFAIRCDARPVGLIDVIRDYPRASTLFVGLLAVIEPCQGRGIGRAAFERLERWARAEIGASRLRLAVVAENPVVGFWLAMGFSETGETRPHAGERVTGTVLLMEKALAPGVRG